MPYDDMWFWGAPPPRKQPPVPVPVERDEYGLPVSGPLRAGDIGTVAGGSQCDNEPEAKRLAKELVNQTLRDAAINTATAGIPIGATGKVAAQGRNASRVGRSAAARGIPSQLNVSGKQFGPKMAQRARELGLDPSNPKVRHQFRSQIERIFKNADEVRSGPFRGQGPNGTIGGDNRFFRRGNDVVVTDANGNFITLLTNGINNGFFKGGVPLP